MHREKERKREDEGRRKGGRELRMFHKLSTVTRSFFSVVNESPVGRMLTRC